MKILKNSTIEMSEVLATIISSRDIVDRLNAHIKAALSKQVSLNFKNVEFVSRSAAHELLTIKEDWKRKSLSRDKEINFINTNEEVSAMLRVVAANRAVPKTKPIFQAEHVDVRTLLKDLA